MQQLQGKTALVTGGSRGIGAAIVRKLAEAGADVAFTYRKSDETARQLVDELQGLGVRARAYQADAGKPESLPAMVQAVADDFGGLDILVNNAGIPGSGMIGEIEYGKYRHTMAVNVDAVFTTTNAAVKVMSDGGRIINIGSILGERASTSGMSIYNASKFAVAGLSRSWAKDLGPRGILVNDVQPGPIDTDLNPSDDSDKASFMRSMTALGRYGTAEEVAGLVVFLAGPDSGNITGATLNVDGGWNA
jgi:3-oxoacyl-[acyl-carrier protein] reductase